MTAQKTIPVLGIVGGIGSGKSAIANGLAQARPIAVIDADLIGHQALDQQPVKQRLRDQFGTEIFDGTDSVIRSELATRVFGPTAEHSRAREALQKIVHPVIQQSIEQQIDDIRHQPDREAVLLDAAVLLETGWQTVCDHIVFIDAPRDQRLQRVSETRNWDAAELTRREATQLPLAEKRSRADCVLDNSGHLDDAIVGLGKIVDRMRSSSTEHPTPQKPNS